MRKQLMKRVVSVMMAFAMLFTLVGVLPVSNVEAASTTSLTMHFNNSDTAWEDVYVYLCVGESWGKVPGYEYAGTWPGAELAANTDNVGWYSFTIDVETGSAMKVIFNNNNGTQTGNIEFTTENEEEEYWVTFTENQASPIILETAPTEWVEDTYVVEAPLKPFVNVTLNVKDGKSWGAMNLYGGLGDSWTAPEKAMTMGTWPGVAMEENAENEGWYTYSLQVRAGTTLNHIFNGNGDKTSDLKNIIGDEDTELWYDTSSSDVSSSTTAPDGWGTEVVEKTKVTLNFSTGTDSWDAVYAYLAEGSSWNLISSSWPGDAVTENADNDGWYTVDLELVAGTELKAIFNNNSGTQTDDIELTIGEEDEEHWVTFAGNQSSPTMTTTAPEDWAVPATETTFEMHFNPGTEDWEKVYVYLAQGSSWGAVSGYGYAGGWPGAEVEEDPFNDGWYSFTLTVDPATELKIILNNNNNGQQTGDLAITTVAGSMEYWMTFGDEEPTTTAPSGWVDCTSNAPVDPNADSTIVSPVVNEDGTVTVYLEDAKGAYDSAVSVNLMGTLNGTGWDEGLKMEKNAEGVYTVTTPVQNPGVYNYKFRISYESGDPTWIIDPMNKADLSGDGNSVVVISGLAGTSLDAKRGVATELPTLKYYDEEGNVSNVAVTYKVTDSDLAEDVSITDGKITIAADSEVETVALQATDASENTATVTVNVVDAVYNYTIYYYDTNAAHMAIGAADMHLWEIDGGDMEPVDFAELETLDDGNTWLKATFSSSVTNFGFIPRSKGTWTWQTGNHYYNNEDKQENVTLYVVYGDDANTYTELPEMKEQRERYVMIDYNRADGDYEGWNIYTWNSGFGSEVTIEPVKIRGKQYFIIPVKDSEQDFNLSFCMRKSTEDNDWAEKDGGDHSITVPADQVLVKAVFDQGASITKVYDYNTGYECKAAEDTISFYYRNDEAVVNGNHANLKGKVSVVIDGTTYAMTYNEEQDRYEYDLTDCETGTHEYYYVVGGEKQLDSFNEETNANGSASVVFYKKIEGLGIEADVYYDSMNYNDNNVVSVEFTEDVLESDEIASATVDLSELGLGVLDIDTALMEVTIAVKDSVSTGTKSLPVEVKDIYGNVYTDVAEVSVTARDADDFDWDEAVIYMTVTDRFFDGNTANNVGVDKDAPLGYHGGDFAGLEEKLDYLKGLGVNTVWVTPIVENSSSADGPGYHGYWASSFTELNSHLGTEEELESLIDALHDRDMKLMVDVVINHAGYSTEDYFNSILGENMIRSAEQTVSGDDIYSSLSGLPDFLTEDADVRAQLVKWHVDWMTKFDIDYYRIDTVKHVDSTTWSMFKNELTKANADFKIIGEYYGAGYANDGGYLSSGTMDSLLDFDFNDKAQEFVTGGLSSVESFLTSRNSALDNTATIGGFLSSHDEDSFVDKLISSGLTEEDALTLAKVAASLQLTSKGQAVIYYGEEIGQHGLENYPIQSNRNDFDWAEAESQAADDDSMLAHYTKLLAIRAEYKELIADGNRTTIAASDENGYDIFKRTNGDESLYFGLNIKDTASTVTFKVSEVAGTQLKDLYNGTVYTVSGSGEVTITIPAANEGGTVILSVVEKDDDDQNKDDQNNNSGSNNTNTGNTNTGSNNTGSNNTGNNNTGNNNTGKDTAKDNNDAGADTGDVAFPIVPVVILVAGAGLALITLKKKYTVK